MSFDPAVLFAALVISSIGFGLFVYGKKQARLPQLAVGLALMTYPYFTSTLSPLVSIALLLIAGLWWALRMGW